jgi:hypothetical protein
MEATNFNMRISKATTLDLLRPLKQPNRGACLKDELGFTIMCKEYGEDDDWVGLEADDFETIRDYDEYQTFEIWF